jgi:hypothetical protein
MKTKLFILLFLIPFLSFGQAVLQPDSWQGLSYELGVGGNFNSIGYYDYDMNYSDSLFSSTSSFALNFYFNVEASLKYGSLYFGTGLIAGGDPYTNLVFYNIPLRVGLRIYPIPKFLYVYGYASAYWGDRIAGADIFNYENRTGMGIGYGVGAGVRLFELISVSAGYNKQQYRIRPYDILKDVNGLEVKVCFLMNYY